MMNFLHEYAPFRRFWGSIRYLNSGPVLFVILLLSPMPSFAEVRIYLFSNMERSSHELKLKDVSRIEADPVTCRRLEGLTVSDNLYSDGYFDKSEVEALAAGSTGELIYVYGNSVHITRSPLADLPEVKHEKKTGTAAAPAPGKKMEPDKNSSVADILVKSGDQVSVCLRKNGITLEVTGSAAGNGKKGDRIGVRIKGLKMLQGKVIDKKTVELSI